MLPEAIISYQNIVFSLSGTNQTLKNIISPLNPFSDGAIGQINFLDFLSNGTEGPGQGSLFISGLSAGLPGSRVPIASLISLCKCMTPDKPLICIDAYAKAHATFHTGFLLHLHQHRAIQTSTMTSSSSPSSSPSVSSYIHIIDFVFTSMYFKGFQGASVRIFRFPLMDLDE